MKLGRAVPMGAALLLWLVLLSGPVAAAAAGQGAARPGGGPDAAARPDGRLELHVVRPGETLSAIAARYRTSVALLVTANELGDPDRIQAGRALMVPVPPPGGNPAGQALGGPSRWHVVRPGDTLWDLARNYGTAVAALVQGNGLANPHRLVPGQLLAIPLAAPGAATGGAAVAGASTRRPGQPPVVPVTAAVPRPVPRRLLLSPARGPVSSAFGWRWGRMHEGIDIAAPDRSPIVAAAAGTVRFAGWLPGYGRTVVVDHGGGLESLYAHASRLLVRAGDRVRAGQTIALVGSSGFATGPHLHFEVRVAGRATNPLDLID